MGRWQHTIYLLRPLAIKLITPRGIAALAILAYVLNVILDPRSDSISNEASIRETLNLDHHLQRITIRHLIKYLILILLGKSKLWPRAIIFQPYFIEPD